MADNDHVNVHLLLTAEQVVSRVFIEIEVTVAVMLFMAGRWTETYPMLAVVRNYLWEVFFLFLSKRLNLLSRSSVMEVLVMSQDVEDLLHRCSLS